MELRKTLLAGLTLAVLTVPAVAFAASPALPATPTTAGQPEARDDEPKAAEAAENNRAADLTEGITEKSAKFDGHQLAGGARISLATARAAALAARAGKITDQELEREHGGSGLRYSFDIKTGAKVYEVGVDAKTGKILENAIEGPMPD